MILRKDAEDIIKRTHEFYNLNNKTHALIQVTDIKEIQMTPVKFNAWDFPKELYSYLDYSIERLEYYWNSRQMIEDDLIPALHTWFGIAEHSAYVGGEVDFSEETSWHHPVILEWSDLDKLELQEDNVWIRMVTDGLKYLKETSDDRYAVKLRGAYAPMDLANILRGNDLFTDFYDYPDQVNCLLEFCCKAVKWTLAHQKKAIGNFYDGIMTGFNIWLPGDSAGHLSEDTASMCSPEIYREFGLPHTARLVEAYDHVLMHIHALGEHTVADIAGIQKIDFIEISNDPNYPRAIDIYKRMAAHLENKIIILELTADEMKKNLDFLDNRKTIICYRADSIKDAKAAVKFVREKM